MTAADDLVGGGRPKGAPHVGSGRAGGASVARHRRLCCASRGTPESAVEERIHRLEDGYPIGLLAGSQQAAADQRGDLGVPQSERVTAHFFAPPPPAAPHPFGGLGAGDPSLFGYRCGYLGHDRSSAPILQRRASELNTPYFSRFPMLSGEGTPVSGDLLSLAADNPNKSGGYPKHQMLWMNYAGVTIIKFNYLCRQ
jgi:hypothetical protein